IVALTVIACGGTKTVVKTVTTQAPAPKTTTPTDTTADDTTADDTTADTTSDDACDTLGINATELNEGLCTAENGARVKIVNRDHTLQLPELTVHYHGFSTQKTLSSDIDTNTASGTYAIFSLTVTNNTDAPVEFDPDQVTLGLSV